MADEHPVVRCGAVLSRSRPARATALRLAAFAVIAAGLVGPAAVVAGSAERAFGRVVLTISGNEGIGDDGPPDPVRYEVDAVMSAESSRFRSGIVVRWELPNIVGDHLGIVALDMDIDALLAHLALPIDGTHAALGYREVARGGVVTFEGTAVEGDVGLFSLGPRERGLAIHVAFGARVVDPLTGAERLLTDGEAATLPDEATHPSNVVVWRDDTPPDQVYLDNVFITGDCTGDPLYDPGYEVEPGAWGPVVYEDEFHDSAGTDYGYGTDHVGVDPDSGTIDPGTGDPGAADPGTGDDWDGWDPGDDWGGDGVNDGGGTVDDGGGWTPGDGVNDGGDGSGGVDAPDGDSSSWDSSDWSDDSGSDDWSTDSGAWDSGDPGGGCGTEDDPGYEDDSLDCAGDDPGSGSDDSLDLSCDGSSSSDSASADPIDCDAKAAPAISSDDTLTKPRARRWRGWNLSPLLALFGWWGFLRYRRGRPLPTAVEPDGGAA